MKCLDQQGLKYLWSLIKDNFATSAEVSNNEAVLSGLAAQLSGHTGNTNNPHNVTKAQIGLGDFECEKGTWTPQLYTKTSSGSWTKESNIGDAMGYYRKVGDIVVLSAGIGPVSLSSKSYMKITGIPVRIDIGHMGFAGMPIVATLQESNIDSEGLMPVATPVMASCASTTEIIFQKTSTSGRALGFEAVYHV